MCCCFVRPNVNGQPGYSWDGKAAGVRPIDPPPLEDGDTLIYDEPGRCGGVDSHAYHFRLVKHYAIFVMIVKHGGGVERMRIEKWLPGAAAVLAAMERMDTHGRYWTMHLIHHLAATAAGAARDTEYARWTSAALEKRIKVRRRNGRSRVEIIDKVSPAVPAGRNGDR